MAEIGAKTQLCGIVLHPAGHTRSPAMHNAAFRALDLDAVYLAFDVPPSALDHALHGVRALGVRQLAVSIPHKVEVMDLVDEVDPVARRIGAVNTVTLREGRLVGSNTDWLGVVRAIENEARQPLDGTRSVVLGAGGAARAAVYALASRGSRVTVLNRTEARARALAEELDAAGSGPLTDLPSIEHDVLVNTTSVGLGRDESPVPASALRSGSLVMDAVYEPERTRLLRDAADRGARTLSGKWMLVHQAAEQLETWTGREAPVTVMAEAFDLAGGAHGGG
jgi:shikimate dehydrogenase